MQHFLHFSVDTKQILYSFIRMAFLLHVIGCIWAVIGSLAVYEEADNWMRESGIINESVISKYTTSCYWAVVTISTVGYGDITPSNEMEMIVTITLMFLGVSMYSYILSRLTSIFSQVRVKREDLTKEKILKDFISRTHLDDKISSQIITYF